MDGRVKHDGKKGNEQQQRGREQADVGQSPVRGVDRSMVGRRYQTGATLRSANAPESAGAVEETQSDALDSAAEDLFVHYGEQLGEASERAGVPAEVAAAIVLTETSTMKGATADRLPIRFEPYKFFERTGDWLVATHKDQQAEYEVFRQARGVDADAAHQSLRMGMAQLSGDEAQAAGYDSAEQMYTSMEASPQVQLDGLFQVITADADLSDAMVAREWQQIAELRAGPGYGALGFEQALETYASAYTQAANRGHGGDDDEDERDDERKRKRKRDRK